MKRGWDLHGDLQMFTNMGSRIFIQCITFKVKGIITGNNSKIAESINRFFDRGIILTEISIGGMAIDNDSKDVVIGLNYEYYKEDKIDEAQGSDKHRE